MNKKYLAVLVASLAATSAFADDSTSVTLYGKIDTAIRYTTDNGTYSSSNKVVNPKTNTAMTSGAFSGSRVGTKGTENLGGGTSAVFVLENGFSPNDGTLNQGGRIFGRQAYIGLKDNVYGEVDVGRQYGVAYEFYGMFDPLQLGSFEENSWQAHVTGLRFDNTVKYSNSWTPQGLGTIGLALEYSVGGQAGNAGAGATSGINANYSGTGFQVGVIGQQSKDVAGNKMTLGGIGGNLDLGQMNIAPVKFFLNYMQAKREAGFAPSTSTTGGALSGTLMWNNSGNKLERTDKVTTVGLTYTVMPKLAFTVGYMQDSIKNIDSLANNGKLQSTYGALDYNLSPRTDVYFTVDHFKQSANAMNDANISDTFKTGGTSSRNGVAVGLRTRF